MQRPEQRPAASLVGVHRNSAALYFHHLRQIIAIELEEESEAMFGGEIDVDESYFGGKRKGKRGCGAAGKIPVFGLLRAFPVYIEASYIINVLRARSAARY